jgi:uncharacterized protein
MGIFRSFDIAAASQRSSLFLFGARQTGKTTLVRQQLPQAIYYNLNEANVFSELSTRPEMIRKRLLPGPATIVIDEIQKYPSLLNEVQAILDSRPDVRLVMTGSSARSLRRHGVNLLGGRAREYRLFPFTTQEIGLEQIDELLRYGSMPPVWNNPDGAEILNDYTGAYLQLEVQAEGYIRNLPTFSRFMEVAALSHGEVVNFTKIGSDAGVPPRTVREHFQLLEDTLVGYLLPSYQGAGKRKPVSNSKFYFFDIGVAHRLMHRMSPLYPGTMEYGRALEHLVMLELKAWLSYNRKPDKLTFWRTYSKHEVDFVIGDHTAIEVKASGRVTERDFKGLRLLAEDAPLQRKVVVSLESQAWRSDDGIEVLPAVDFFRQLWAGG